jgi:signal transduction histidine kinase
VSSDAPDVIPLRRVPTDLRLLLQSSIGVMDQQARAMDVALALTVDPAVPPTLALDRQKIAWAITALVGNAMRFVRRGTRLRPGGTIAVRALADPAGSAVVIEVEDDGAGIAADKLPHLLDRASEQPYAAGLALNLVQDVVTAHGGAVEIESSTRPERSGTTVRLVLPRR